MRSVGLFSEIIMTVARVKEIEYKGGDEYITHLWSD